MASDPEEKVSVQNDIAGVEPQTKLDFEQAIKERTPPLVSFRETKNAVLVHDFRIYIQGVDVTPWVRGSVSVTYANRDGFNTASFTLDNAMDKFVLTEENLGLRPAAPSLSSRAPLVDPTSNAPLNETWAARVYRWWAEEAKPVSERSTGEQDEEDVRFLPPRFRLDDPMGPNWRYSEAAKYEVFLYKSGITKTIQANAARDAENTYDTVIPYFLAEQQREDRPSIKVAEEVVESVLDSMTSGTKNRKSLTDENGKLTNRGVAVRDALVERLKGESFTEETAEAVSIGLPEGEARKIVNKEIARRAGRDKALSILAKDSGISESEAEAILAFRDRERRRRERGSRNTESPPGAETREEKAGRLLGSAVEQISRLDPRVSAEAARRRGEAVRNKVKEGAEKVTGVRNVRDPDTGRTVWPLVPKATIFHKNDPIRIFIKNPHNEEDEWMFAFTGFVDQADKTNDYVTGESNIAIQCYDIRSLMQKMRVSFSVHDAHVVRQEPLFQDRSNYFSDLLLPSRWGHAFFSRNLEETVTALITGKKLSAREVEVEGVDSTEIGDQLDQELEVAGIGRFKRGNTIEYPRKLGDPESSVNKKILELWHTQAFTNKPDGSFLTQAEVAAIGSETTTDGQFAPDVANLHFLLPPGGTGVRDLVQGTFETGTNERDWTERYSVITEFVSRLNYEWMVLPTGDIAVEFPMIDFLPHDFGGYDPLLRADLQLINGNVTDEQGDITTALVATGSPTRISNVANFQGDQAILEEAGIIPKVLVQPSVLAARVGMRVETISLPHIVNPARLHAMALVEYEKKLAEVAVMSMSFGYRPLLLPNRPMLNNEELRIGITSSATQTINIFDQAESSVELKYIRTMEMDGTFRHVTGGTKMPISYRQVETLEDLQKFRKVFGADTRTTGIRVASPIDRGALDDQNTDQAEPGDSTDPDQQANAPAVHTEPKAGRQRAEKGRSSLSSDDRFVFRLTRYDIANEADESRYPHPKEFDAIPLLDPSGGTIAEVAPSFFCDMLLQGSGRLKDGRIVGIARRGDAIRVDPSKWQKHIEDMRAVRARGLCTSPRTGNLRGIRFTSDGGVIVRTFTQRPSGEADFGHGAGSDLPIIPFKTIAADIGRLKNSEPAWQGKGGLTPLNTTVYIEAFDGLTNPWDGSKHDGTFRITDTGGAIFGAHFDIFTGTRQYGELLHPPHYGIVEYNGIEQKFEAAEARVGANPGVGTYYGYGLKRDPKFTVRNGSGLLA